MFGRGKSGERRSVNRYVAVGSIALGWRDGVDFRSVDATLVDISQYGVCVTARSAPQGGAPAWMLLGDGKSELWLRGVVIDVSRGWRGPYKIRVRFDEPCPYDIMRSSIQGMKFQDADVGGGPEELRDRHFWR